MYYSTSEIGTTSVQGTKLLSPLFRDSTVLGIIGREDIVMRGSMHTHHWEVTHATGEEERGEGRGEGGGV